MAREAALLGKAWQSVSWLVLGEAAEEATVQPGSAQCHGSKRGMSFLCGQPPASSLREPERCIALPGRFAAFIPATTRSPIRSRSNCAMVPRTLNSSRPVGCREVSIDWPGTIRSMPGASNSPATVWSGAGRS